MQVSDKELYDRLTERAELAEGNFKKLQECCEMAKAYVNKFMDQKNDWIGQLREQCHILSKAQKAETTKVEEVEQLMQKKEEEYTTTNN